MATMIIEGERPTAASAFRSLDRLGFASLDPSLRDGGVQNRQR